MILGDQTSQETRMEELRERIMLCILSCLRPHAVLHCTLASQRPLLSSQPLSRRIALVQLTFLFNICVYVPATWQGSASCFSTHKLQDWKLLKIQKCQNFQETWRIGEWRNSVRSLICSSAPLSAWPLPCPFLLS